METKERILKTLKDFGKLPSSKLCAIAGLNYNTFLGESKILVEKKLVEEIKETTATYWEITKKGLHEVNDD